MASLPKHRVVVGAEGQVTVHTAPEVLYNIDALQQLQRSVLGRLGCPTCHSGLPIAFQLAEGEMQQ